MYGHRDHLRGKLLVAAWTAALVYADEGNRRRYKASVRHHEADGLRKQGLRYGHIEGVRESCTDSVTGGYQRKAQVSLRYQASVQAFRASRSVGQKPSLCYGFERLTGFEPAMPPWEGGV